MKAAVIVFPGSNCDRDAAVALTYAADGNAPEMVWHGAEELPANTDLVVLPGGFSYGDYLRCGAMAARAAIMPAIRTHAERGGLVLGICNGFQILTETGLLPGTLLPNASLKFICREALLRVEQNTTAFTSGYQQGEIVNFPIAHHDGNYYADDATLARLEGNGQILFRYVDAAGEATAAANPNGARNNIAGITNEKGNVLGMMPHPERHADPLTGGADGKRLFHSLLRHLAAF